MQLPPTPPAFFSILLRDTSITTLPSAASYTGLSSPQERKTEGLLGALNFFSTIFQALGR